MVILPLTAGTPIDSVKVPDAESECFARCERLEARLLELAPPPPPPPPPPAIKDITLVPTGQNGEQDQPLPPPRKKPGSRRPPSQ